MHGAFESEVLHIAAKHLKLREHYLVANPHHGYRGALHPALTMIVMPSSRQYHVVHCNRALMSFMDDVSAHVASYSAPVASEMDVTKIAEKVFQCFLAAEAYDRTVQHKRHLHETIMDILKFRSSPAVTVPRKPSFRGGDGADGGDHNFTNDGGLSLDAWQHVASFLPASDLLQLPHVGSIFFSFRLIVVWWNLYERCFGHFTPQQLRLLRRDCCEDDDDDEDDGGDSTGALDTTPACAVEPDHESEPVYYEIDHRQNLREALLPHISAHKRDSGFGLRLSVDGFFDSIAPRGAITLGKRRFLLVNASPLHFLTIKRAGPYVRAVEVLTEDLTTSRGTVQLITVAVAVTDGTAAEAAAVHEKIPLHLLAVTPELRRAVVAAARSTRDGGVIADSTIQLGAE